MVKRRLPWWKRALLRAAGIRADTINSNSSWKKAYFSQVFGVGGGYDSANRLRKVGQPIPDPEGSANDFLGADLKTLTRQLRHMFRNNSTIRATTKALRADIVGSGVDIIPTTGDTRIDEALKNEWAIQRENLGASGEDDLQLTNLWCNEFALAGNCIGRFIPMPEKADIGLVPLAIVPLEVEWLSDMPANIADGNSCACGVEYDQFGRLVALHLLNPDKTINGKVERVPASDLIFSFDRVRPTQALGEPHLVAIIERALQRGRLINAELQSAINASNFSTYTESDFHEEPNDEGDTDPSGNSLPITDFPLGVHAQLRPGEKLGVVKTDRPNTDVQTFAMELNKDLSAAAGVSKVWLDRDGSAYNFANSKFDQIRSNQLIRANQAWFVPGTIGAVYQKFVPFMLAKLGIPMPTDPIQRRAILSYRYQPDVPAELDEKASAEAFEKSWQNDIGTHEEYLGSRGKDYQKVFKQISAERTLKAEAEIERIKAIQIACNAANTAVPGLNLSWEKVVTIAGAVSAPGAYLTAAKEQKEPEDASTEDPEEKEEVEDDE